MKITDIEYVAPTQSSQIGSVKFTVEVPVMFKEGETKSVIDNESADVSISPETQKAAQSTAVSLIKDITG